MKRVSLVLKDSDIESEKNQFVDLAFCIRWPENRQFKRGIIERYIIKQMLYCHSAVLIVCGIEGWCFVEVKD